MRTIGLPLSHDRLDAPLSDHFGKAKWLAVVPEDGPPRFLRNEGLSGGWVAGVNHFFRFRPYLVFHIYPSKQFIILNQKYVVIVVFG